MMLMMQKPEPSSPVSVDPLPTSVRGAPSELRRQIRKRQNSESAKRCRQRKKLESLRVADEVVAHAKHLARLEALVAHLARSVDATAAVVSDLASQVTLRCACGGPGCNACAAVAVATAVPPTPPPLPTPIKRSLAMMSAGMPVGPAQVRAVRAAQTAQAEAASRQAAHAQASMDSIASQTAHLQLTMHERHSADVMAIATKIDELEAYSWN